MSSRAKACLRASSEKIARSSDRGTEVSRGRSRGNQTGEGLKALQSERRSNRYTEPQSPSKAPTVLSPSGEGKWCGSTDRNLVSEERQNSQLRLAFAEGNEGEAFQDSSEGTNAPAARTNSDDPVLNQPNRRGTDPYARWCGRGDHSPLSRFCPLMP